MAESMKGLHRTCRCAEVTKEMIGSRCDSHGMGTEGTETKVVSFLLTFVTVPGSCS